MAALARGAEKEGGRAELNLKMTPSGEGEPPRLCNAKAAPAAAFPSGLSCARGASSPPFPRPAQERPSRNSLSRAALPPHPAPPRRAPALCASKFAVSRAKRAGPCGRRRQAASSAEAARCRCGAPAGQGGKGGGERRPPGAHTHTRRLGCSFCGSGPSPPRLPVLALRPPHPTRIYR